MNKIKVVILAQTPYGVTALFRREKNDKVHYFNSYESLKVINLARRLKEVCTIESVAITPGHDEQGYITTHWSVHYAPKPTGKVVKAYPENSLEGERAYIRSLYVRAGDMSNTEPIGAALLYHRAEQLENAWYEKYCTRLDEEETIMPVSFYRDVVPLIKSRASAA